MARKSAVQQRLEIAEVLHPIGQRIADDGNLVGAIEHQPRSFGGVGRGKR